MRLVNWRTFARAHSDGRRDHLEAAAAARALARAARRTAHTPADRALVAPSRRVEPRRARLAPHMQAIVTSTNAKPGTPRTSTIKRSSGNSRSERWNSFKLPALGVLPTTLQQLERVELTGRLDVLSFNGAAAVSGGTGLGRVLNDCKGLHCGLREPWCRSRMGLVPSRWQASPLGEFVFCFQRAWWARERVPGVPRQVGARVEPYSTLLDAK